MSLDLVKEILRLKEEKGALILAHLYQRPEIQEIADIVGDSYFLSKKAVESTSNLIIFCGVGFMAESAKILSPNKRVLLPAKEARCPMADMAILDRVLKLKEEHPNAKIISYINTNLDIKAISDVCVTSSSALKIMNNIKEKDIIFVPDRNLGEYISEHFEDKNFILYQGFCPTHERVEKEDILKLKEEYPNYEVLVHPECNKGVRSIADYIGSTSELINYSVKSPSKGFIVVTEEGVLYQMKNKSPNKEFIPLKEPMICPNMKMTTLDELYNCLLNESNEIIIDEEKRVKALTALQNMHLLGDD
ncbi:MAG: quinolinate synthase NadA [Clostridiales bacterium]|nr:quinolinate synthase NadA [Clostridiales bacterium]